MPTHKFTIGEKVRLQLGLLKTAMSDGEYEIVRLMPSENNDHQYRVRDINGRHERVVRESQLK